MVDEFKNKHINEHFHERFFNSDNKHLTTQSKKKGHFFLLLLDEILDSLKFSKSFLTNLHILGIRDHLKYVLQYVCLRAFVFACDTNFVGELFQKLIYGI